MAFDVCHGLFSEVREICYIRLATSNFDSIGDGLWRPRHKPELIDYCADFALAGKAALDRPGRRKLLPLFRIFHLGGASYVAARRHLGVGEITWSDWVDQIRASVGQELLRRKIFPPSKYFILRTDIISSPAELIPQPLSAQDNPTPIRA